MKIVRKHRTLGDWEAYVYSKLKNGQMFWNGFHPSSQDAELGLSLTLRLLWFIYSASCKAICSIGLNLV